MFRLFKRKPNFMCPFCIQKLEEADIFYICGKCDKKVEVTPKMLKNPPVKCSCGGLATKRACSKCSDASASNWSVIPRAVLQVPYFPFSIVGVAGSGKTNFITVMLEELQRQRDLGLDLAVIPLNNDAERLQSEHKKKMYDEHESPDPTEPGERPAPQIWQIQKRVAGNKKTVPTYTFTIFDGAGEHSQDNTNGYVNDYIMHSEAIIITVDPLTLFYVRGKIDKDDANNSERDYAAGERTRAEVALGHVVELIKNAKGLGTNEKLDIPAAIVLTKFDTVLGNAQFRINIGPNVQQKRIDIRDKKINVDQMRDASDDIEQFLADELETNFVELVKLNFRTYRFFGVSSYGKPPNTKGAAASKIEPHRILDPILWLLHHKGFID